MSQYVWGFYIVRRIERINCKYRIGNPGYTILKNEGV